MSHPERRQIVNGKPYISVSSATRKALKPPKAIQSRLVFGLKKLKAKAMKIAEFSTARNQRPYAGSAEWFMACVPLPGGYCGRSKRKAAVATGRPGRLTLNVNRYLAASGRAM